MAVTFSQMETFILVAEKRSLAQAARDLDISTAAISKQLTSMEKDLGLQLLSRSTRKVELTEAGTIYYEQCKRILEEIEIAKNLISKIKAVPHGDLKVFSGRHFATSCIVPYIREFLNKYPEIRLNLELAERMPNLETESVDVLIGMSLSAEGNVIQRRIASTHYVLCASPKYLNKFGRPKTPQDLLKHQYITHSMRKPDCELLFSSGVKIRLKPYLYVNDAETMAKLAENDLGIVKLHEYVVRDALREGRLEEVLGGFAEKQVPIYAAFPMRKFLPAKTRCFVDFIIKKLQKAS